MSATLRAATPDDIKKIAEIEAVSFPDPWTENSFTLFMHDKIHFTVLENNGNIIGYAVLELSDENVSEIYNISIAPASRKKGYSRILMDDIVAVSRAHKKQKIWLEVRESNESAIALYKKYGFKPDGIRKNYYHNPTENGLLMTLDL